MEDLLKQVLIELKDLKQGQERLEGRFDNLEGRFDRLEGKVENLEKGQIEIKEKLDGIQEEYARTMQDLSDKVDEVIVDVKEINDGLNIVETVTAKNWNDIVKLKAVK